MTGNRSVIVPTQAAIYYVHNNTDGAYTLTVTTAAGTGVVVGQKRRCLVHCDGTNVELLQTDPHYQDIAYGASITPDSSDGERIIVATLTGDITINAPTNPVKGAKLTFSFTQDGTGSRAITWDAAFVKASDGAGGASTQGATEFIYDGANWVQIGGALAWA